MKLTSSCRVMMVSTGYVNNTYCMFRAIGFLIILWGLSQYFYGSFAAIDGAGVASFEAIETAARSSQQQFLQE